MEGGRGRKINVRVLLQVVKENRDSVPGKWVTKNFDDGFAASRRRGYVKILVSRDAFFQCASIIFPLN